MAEMRAHFDSVLTQENDGSPQLAAAQIPPVDVVLDDDRPGEVKPDDPAVDTVRLHPHELYNSENYQEALTGFEQLLADRPADLGLQLGVGMCMAKLPDRAEEAISSLSAVIIGYERFYATDGLLYTALMLAKAYRSRALAYSAGDRRPRSGELIKIDLDKVEEYLSHLRHHLDFDPKSIIAPEAAGEWVGTGELRSDQLKEHAVARDHYTRAVELYTNSPMLSESLRYQFELSRAYFLRACANHRSGISNNLLADLQKAEEWQNRVVSKEGLPDKQKSKVELALANTLNNIVWLRLESGACQNARDECLHKAERAVELSGRDKGQFLDTLARVHWSRGEREKAIEDQKEAIAAILADSGLNDEKKGALKSDFETRLRQYQDDP